MVPVDTGRTETVQHHLFSALGRKMPDQSFDQFWRSCLHPLHSSALEIPAPFCTRVSVLQPGGSRDASVDTVDSESHLEALMEHVAGCLAVPGVSAAAEVNVLMDSGLGIAAMPDELVEALQRQPEMMQTALAQVLVGHEAVVTSLRLECDVVTQSCPLHLMIETP